jgi:tetratricopeptide (TPR) repeat protein
MLLFSTDGLAQLPSLVSEALDQQKAGNLKKAVKIYTEAIKKHPDSPEAYNWRGMAYDDLGDLDKAKADFDKAVRLSPDWAEPYNNRGEVFRKQGKYAEAMKNYRLALKYDKDFAEPHYNIGLVYEAEHKPFLAAKEYLEYFKANPADSDRKGVLKKIQASVKATPVRSRAQRQLAQKPTSGQTPPAAAEGVTRGEKGRGRVPAPLQALGAQKKGTVPGPLPEQTLAPIAGLLLGMGVLAFIIPVVIYLFLTLMVYLIARKTNTSGAWLAFIPIANLYLLVKIAGKPGWWFWVILIPALAIGVLQGIGILSKDIAGPLSGIAGLVNFVLLLLIWLAIAKARSKSVIWGILTWLPCTSPIGLAYLGLSE